MLPVLAVPIALALSSRDELMRDEAKAGVHRIPEFGTEQTLQNAIFPELVMLVGSAFATATLIIGLPPTGLAGSTEGQL